MDNQKRSDDEEQLEEHSLPGINMAGKGPGECEEENREHERAEENASRKDGQIPREDKR